MFWPSKLTDLDHAGYSYTGTVKICDCGTRTLFFVTPERKHIELSALGDSRLVPHQSVCVRVKELRATTRRQDDGARGGTVQPLLFSEKNAAAPAVRSSARPMSAAGRVFGGAAYVPSLDRARLSVQVERIRRYMGGVEWRTLREIKAALEDTYAPALFPEASISAQLRNLKKPPCFYRLMKRRRVGVHGPGAGIWEYRLLPPAESEDAKKEVERALDAIHVDAGSESRDGKGREKCFSSHAGFDPSTHFGSAKKEGFFNG